jgi:hypothetical protein
MTGKSDLAEIAAVITSELLALIVSQASPALRDPIQRPPITLKNA